MSKINYLFIVCIVILALLVVTAIFSSLDAKSPYDNPTNIKLLDKTPEDVLVKNEVQKIKLEELNLSSDRIIYIFGEINEENSVLITKQLLLLSQTPEPITIIINSPGGSVLDGAAIISAMEAAKGPVNTLCTQLCASMAAMIFEFGTERMMLNRSIVMEHPASIGGMGGELDKVNSRVNTLQRYISKIEKHVAKRSKMTYEQYKLLSGVELWLDAEDAVTKGFADKIVFVRGNNSGKLFLDPILLGNKHNNKVSTPFIVNPLKIDWIL